MLPCRMPEITGNSCGWLMKYIANAKKNPMRRVSPNILLTPIQTLVSMPIDFFGAFLHVETTPKAII